MEDSLSQAFNVCRQIHKQHGTSYYFATRLFPKDIRLATHALYAFFRIADEIVDEAGDGADRTRHASPAERLEEWSHAWYEAHVTGTSSHPVLQATAHIFHRFHIPFAYSEAFLKAMQQDVTIARYATYADLRDYMYGSAAVVGLMMTHVIGFSDKRALAHAESLGYAMQLTNFLRDIREDLERRGRIYLPQDELAAYGISEEDITHHRVTSAWKNYVDFQVKRADALYEEANAGIHYLHPRGRIAVRAGSDLYRLILRKIELQGYDVFQARARTSLAEKITCVLTRSIWKSDLLRRSSSSVLE